MDSVTQIALGAAITTACVPIEHRRKAVFIGAILGTTPDLDVFIDYGDAVSNFTYHRGFSHSLFVLIPFSLIVWVILKKYYDPVKSAPIPWLFAISLTLITHPLLDAHTAYGTQLFWPLTTPPVMWSTIFIIDPLYTLPLLMGVIVVLVKPLSARAIKTLVVGIVISHVYLAWTWTAKFYIEYKVAESLTPETQFISTFSTPTPFNSLLWRVVVLQEKTYQEGYYSLLSTNQSINFQTYSRNTDILNPAKELASIKRLQWFAQDYISSSIINNFLVISDLRMGFEGNYVFNHAVAEMGNPHWHEIEGKLLPSQFGAEDLSTLWNKFSDD